MPLIKMPNEPQWTREPAKEYQPILFQITPNTKRAARTKLTAQTNNCALIALKQVAVSNLKRNRGDSGEGAHHRRQCWKEVPKEALVFTWGG